MFFYGIKTYIFSVEDYAAVKHSGILVELPAPVVVPDSRMLGSL